MIRNGDEDDDLTSKVKKIIKRQEKKAKSYVEPREIIGFEQARDGFRFFTNLLYAAMIGSLLAIVFSYGCYLLKERAHTYTTSTTGRVDEVHPYLVK